MPAPRRTRSRPMQLPAAHARRAAANIHVDTDQAGGVAGRGETGGGKANVGAAARRGLTAPRQPSYGAPIVLVVDDGETNRTLVQAFLSGAIVNISVPPSVAVAPDPEVWLEFDQERLHLFDGESEMALTSD